LPATAWSTETLTSTPLIPLVAWVSVTTLVATETMTGSVAWIALRAFEIAVAMLFAEVPDAIPTMTVRPATRTMMLPSAVAAPVPVIVWTLATPELSAMPTANTRGPRWKRFAQAIASRNISASSELEPYSASTSSVDRLLRSETVFTAAVAVERCAPISAMRSGTLVSDPPARKNEKVWKVWGRLRLFGTPVLITWGFPSSRAAARVARPWRRRARPRTRRRPGCRG
jgi:hypothetical protein